MKNISIIFFILSAFFYNSVSFAQGGSDCTAALANPITLPFSASGQTTCGFGNTYTGGNSTYCGSSLYLLGEDRLYAFTPVTSGAVNITLTSGSSYVGLKIYAGCPIGGSCISNSQSSFGSQSINGAFVTAGVTYFVLVDTYPPPNCLSNYTLNITAPFLPTPTVQDCDGAIPICNYTYNESSSYSGSGNYSSEINGVPSCLNSGEKNDVWYIFTVQTSGNVCFDITPNDLSDDYDWAVYDLTNNPCSDIFTNPALEVSCNFDLAPGITGPNGGSGWQEEPCIPVNVGETYAINVGQYSTSPNGYEIDLSASTATIFDNVAPSLQTVIQPIPCAATTLSFDFSENILCSSISLADFTLTGPGGPYTLSNLTGTNCDVGGTQENQFTADVSPALTTTGAFQLCLVSGAGFVEDLCGNVASAGCLNFNIINSSPNPGTIGTHAYCASSSSSNLFDDLGGSPDVGGVWSGPSTLTGGDLGTFNPSTNSAGVYTYTLTGCGSASQTVTVIINSTPIADAPANVTACSNYTLPTLTVGNYFSATGGVGPIATGTVINSSQNIYVYAETGTTPNCVDENSFTVTINTTPVADAPANVNACNDYTLPALTVGNYFSATGGVGSIATGTVVNSSQTIYIYAETGTTPNCTDENSFTVTINAAPVADAPVNVTVCTDYTLPALIVGNYFSATGGVGPVTTGTVINSNQTIYIYAETGTTPNCVDENSFTITINTPPVADALANVTACSNYTLPALTVGNYFSATGGVGPIATGTVINSNQNIYVYAETGTTPNCTNENSFTVTINTTPVADAPANVTACSNYSLPALTVGNYFSATGGVGPITTGTVINSNQTIYVYAETGTTPNCTNENSFTVTITPNLVVNTGLDATICEGNSYPLTVSPNGVGYNFVWDEPLNMGFENISNPIVNPILTTTYTVTVTDLNNCSGTDQITINVNSSPSISLGADTSTCNEFIVLIAESGFSSYLWQDGSSNLTYIVESPGVYSITISDVFGCTASDDIEIIRDCPFSIWVPNTFTPNGDDYNDVFTVISENLVSLEVLIFNRWGQQIHSWNHIEGFWDGRTDSGNMVPDGTYPYIIKFSYKESVVIVNQIKTGHITVFR